MPLNLGPDVKCARCGNHRPHKARGLCNPCYTTAHQRGTKHQWPRTYLDAQTRADRLEDYQWLIDTGTDPGEAASRVGGTLADVRRWQVSA